MLQSACGVAAVAVLFAKLFLVWRINVNWDEFYFLSNVYSLVRGELALLLQGPYTHLFTWVTYLDMQEVDQIIVLRVLMWTLLVLSSWLLYRLACRWASPVGAKIAVLAFLSTWPVMKHGSSFRADSMLLPLTLAALLLAGRVGGRRFVYDAGAGLCLGAAFVLTTKAVLMIPVLVLVTVLSDSDRTKGKVFLPIGSLKRIGVSIGTAALLSVALIAVHSTQVLADFESAGDFAARAVTTTLLDVPIAPRAHYFQRLVLEDAVYWLALSAGLLVAIRRRKFAAASCILSLLPVLFYRNAFPYYYTVMIAPVSILIALFADEILREAERRGATRIGVFATAVLGLLLVQHAWENLMALRFDEQAKQRSVIAAVHKVFPAPVPYIDHSGMMASFPKANFFMSSWGIETYLRLGRNFLPEVLEKYRPPLLLVNHGVLQPGALLFRQLSEVDQQLLVSSYVDYWGPLKVAGVEVLIPAGQATSARLPFPGRYRIESSAEILVDGKRFRPGETIDTGDSIHLVLETVPPFQVATTARLVWAAAQDRPSELPPDLPLYSPL
jgi:hypothetical protein